MRPFSIQKIDISSNTGLKRSIGRKGLSIEFFFFQWCEKWLCYCIVMRLPGCEKDCFAWCSCKSCWKRWEVYCAPRSLWKMRPDGGIALLMRHFECGRDELCVVLFWNLIFNYSAREEVGNHANIEIVVSELETGDITNPSLVRPLGTGLLPKNVFLALWLTHFQIFLLRCRSNTAEFISRMRRAIYAALT